MPRLRAQRRAVRPRRRPASATTCSALGRFDAVIEASAEPSVLAGPVRRRRLPRPDEPRRRVQLPRAVPARRRAARVPLDEPRVPDGGASCRRLRGDRRRGSSSPTTQPCPGRLVARHRRDVPAGRRAHAVRRDEARGRAPDRRVRVGVRAAGRRSIGAASSPARGRWARSTRACSPTGCSRTGFGRPLAYIGYGGSGKQVRDVLHVDDLVGPARRSSSAIPSVGAARSSTSAAGVDFSLSLLELTELCRAVTGTTVEIAADPSVRPGDVPIYVSDCSALFAHTDWRPHRQPSHRPRGHLDLGGSA